MLPDDFKIEVGYEGNPFKELFMKLETILAAGFIASNATIQGGQMKLQIMGQRSVDYVCRLNEITGTKYMTGYIQAEVLLTKPLLQEILSVCIANMSRC